MKARTIISLLTSLAFVYNCSRHPSEEDFCQTKPDTKWTQTLIKDSLAGNWIIDNIDFKKGTGATTFFDTSYNPNAQLFLNTDGSGTLNLIPISWSLTIQANRMPVLAFTKMNNLFPFQVNLIQNDTLVTNIQLYPQTRFYVLSGLNENGNWEESTISFGRQ